MDINLNLTQDEECRILADRARHVFREAPVGRAWDIFGVNGKRFELIDVSERSLAVAASTYYRLERCGSPEDFIRRWKADHRGHWDPEQMIFIHWFRDISFNQTNDLV